MACDFKLGSRAGIVAGWVLLAPAIALASGGRHVAPNDRAPSGQQGSVQSGYGRATIYRADEPPKPASPMADQPAGSATPETIRARQPAKVHPPEGALPVIIQGVPHRFRLHYSQTAC